MRLLNIGGRAVLDFGGGYVDVAATSDGLFGPDPQALFARWPELREWTANLGKQVTGPCTFAQEDLGLPPLGCHKASNFAGFLTLAAALTCYKNVAK